jgi:hypothetical protein
MRNDWIIAFKVVKVQHSHVVVSLIFEFEQWFPSWELMNAIDIIYLQYWLNLHVKEMFWRHLALLRLISILKSSILS